MAREADILELRTRHSAPLSSTAKPEGKRRGPTAPKTQVARASAGAAAAVGRSWTKPNPTFPEVMKAAVKLVRTVGEDAALRILKEQQASLRKRWRAKAGFPRVAPRTGEQ